MQLVKYAESNLVKDFALSPSPGNGLPDSGRGQNDISPRYVSGLSSKVSTRSRLVQKVEAQAKR